MIIGIDAGALGILDERLKLGVYQVNAHLLHELAKIDTKNIYHLYSFEPINEKLLHDFGPRMKNIVLTPKIGWATVRLPFELKLHPVDVFLGFSQFIPPTKAYNIGFLYDLGFLRHPEAYPDSQIKLMQITDHLIDRSQKIITISQTVKNDIMNRYHLASKKISVAYPGVGESFTNNGKVFKGEYPYFLYVGALKPGKNIPFLLKSFSEFLASHKQLFDLILVGGEYWKDPEIDRTIASLGLTKRVKKSGFVDEYTLAAYYRGARAFVSPSLYEGFCLPAVEAMACGTPVIGSTSGAFPEIVGRSGILVDPHDTRALARAMKELSQSAVSRLSLSKKGLTQAKKYRWRYMAEAVLSVIQQKL